MRRLMIGMTAIPEALVCSFLSLFFLSLFYNRRVLYYIVDIDIDID